MEPPGGIPPDRVKDHDKDRKLMLRSQQQQQQQQQHHHHQATSTIATASVTTTASTTAKTTIKPNTLTLNLPNQQQSQKQHSLSAAITTLPTAHATSPGAAPATSATTPTLASAATAISATTQAATAFSGSSIAHQQHGRSQHHQHHHQPSTSQQHSSHQIQQLQLTARGSCHPPLQANSSISGSSTVLHTLSSTSAGGGGGGSGGNSQPQQQQTIEKLSRPMAFDKMEALVREMQDPEHGVPVRQQKMFLTSIPYAFMGYDLIEWLMDRLMIEESEALNIANQLCLHGYFFPVNDTKTLTVKDDSSLYRFQTPYYWPWQHKAPDNVEYAIYLVKRSLRNKQRHALEDYEAETLGSLHKNLKGKWEFIAMQAEEQVRLAKERKKGDKIVGDSQERAYWRVHRPPPGQFTPLEPCPVPSRDRQGTKQNKKKTIEDVQREVDYLTKSLNRTRMKMSQACESLVSYSETFMEYDFFLQPVLPSNPWVTEDITFWQLNNTFVDIPTEKRVRRWAISIEELVSDPTGLQEFTSFLEKEYSHENIRFWIAVNRLRRSAHSQVARKVQDIYEEFLKPGAPCEINIDGKTMESVLKGLKNPSRFTFDAASEHIYMLLLKKDCYPRFIRSDHYKRLLETGIQPSHKKRFFNFGGVGGAKKKMTAALSSQPNLGDGSSSLKGASCGGISSSMMQAPPPGSLSRRRGSDRSLTGSAHELAVIGVNKDSASKVPHSHSQSNLSEIPYSSDTIYRGDMPHQHLDTGHYAGFGNNNDSYLHSYHQQQDTSKSKPVRLETTVESAANSAVCPWDMPDEPPTTQAPVPTKSTTSSARSSDIQLSVCPWEQSTTETQSPAVKANSTPQRLTSTSSDISDVADRMQRNLGIRHQNTVDSGEAGIKRLVPNFTEQRRASVSFTPGRPSEYVPSRTGANIKTNTPSPTVGHHSVIETTFLPFVAPLHAQKLPALALVTRDPPSDFELDEELQRLSISERNSESSASELQMEGISPPTPIPTPTVTPTPTTPPTTKVTPPPPPQCLASTAEIETKTTQQQQSNENPSESPQSDVFTVEATSNVVEEVVALVHEVKIELIESPPSAAAAEVQRELPLARVPTPTIQIEEELEVYVEIVAETSKQQIPSRTPSPKSLSQSKTPEKTPEHVLLLETALPPPPPPPVPEIGPLEEEAQLQQLREEEEALAAQEELSPTTEEYNDGMRFGGDSKDDYSYEIVDTDSQAGYVPPAPTPAPSMAPLAELDVDTVDDDFCCEAAAEEAAAEVVDGHSNPMVEVVTLPSLPAAACEEVKKRRKKRSSDGKKMSSLEEKDKEKAGSSKAKNEDDRNAVCPWEDENVSTSDGTFVKTYATLGYL